MVHFSQERLREARGGGGASDDGGFPKHIAERVQGGLCWLSGGGSVGRQRAVEDWGDGGGERAHLAHLGASGLLIGRQRAHRHSSRATQALR